MDHAIFFFFGDEVVHDRMISWPVETRAKVCNKCAREPMSMLALGPSGQRQPPAGLNAQEISRHVRVAASAMRRFDDR